MARRIAVVDDDETSRELLQVLLELCGYSVRLHDTAGKFLDSLSKEIPDLAVIDLQLPGVSGWDVLKVLKESPDNRRISIFLISSHHKKTSDLVRGLEMGADDYITKPFDNEVFLARIEALLRRVSWQTRAEPDERVWAGPLVIDQAEHTTHLHGKNLALTRLEFDFLLYMAKNLNRVLTRGIILEQVWKVEPSMSTRTVDKHVELLRGKLGPFGKKIETVIGVGYILRM